MQQHPQCAALWARAEKTLAGGPGTLSKSPSRFPMGLAPTMLTSGDGAHVTCPDGHTYVDVSAALGPIILSHRHPAVTEAVWEQVDRLACSSLSTPLEVEVAELLCDMIPGAEMARFASNGADVCNAAVKVARYVTGKKHVVFSGYHGGGDSYLATTDKNGGLLPDIALFNQQVPFGNWPALYALIDRIGADLAALMVEVPPRAWGEEKRMVADILLEYQAIARDRHALLVCDEVVTGFRYALGGAQEYYGIRGDLTCLSKALANGFPCAALTGPRDLMRAFDGGKTFLSTTFGAQCVGLAAAKATLTTLRDTDALARLQAAGQEIGRRLTNAICDLRSPCQLRGNYARMVVDWHPREAGATGDELRTLWLQELLTHNVLASVPIFSMSCYEETTVDEVSNAMTDALIRIKEVADGRVEIRQALKCPVITDVFQGRYAPREGQAI